MINLHLIMPMGGAGTRFFNDGYIIPKPLIKIHEKPFFYWSTQSILKFIEVKSLTFVILQEHIEKFDIKNEILKFYPNAYFEVIDEVLNGAVLTCVEGIKNIPENEPILFNDCDHLFYSSAFNDIIKNNLWNDIDGGLITFTSNESKFSFLTTDKNGYVNKTVEKEVISNNAICGAYYFINKQIFKVSTEKYLDLCKYKEYFVSGVYNVMINENLKIKHCSVDIHISFGTPEEFEYATTLNDEFKRFI